MPAGTRHRRWRQKVYPCDGQDCHQGWAQPCTKSGRPYSSQQWLRSLWAGRRCPASPMAGWSPQASLRAHVRAGPWHGQRAVRAALALGSAPMRGRARGRVTAETSSRCEQFVTFLDLFCVQVWTNRSRSDEEIRSISLGEEPWKVPAYPWDEKLLIRAGDYVGKVKIIFFCFFFQAVLFSVILLHV